MQVLWVGASLMDGGGTLWASDMATDRTYRRGQLVVSVVLWSLVAAVGWMLMTSSAPGWWRQIVGLPAFLVGAMTSVVGVVLAVAWIRAPIQAPKGKVWMDSVVRDPEGRPGAGGELARWVVDNYTSQGRSVAWKAEHPDLVEYWADRFPEANRHGDYFVMRHTVASSDPDGSNMTPDNH